MSRIVYATPGVLGPNGGMRVIFEHVTHLMQNGHNVSLLAPSAQRPAWYLLSAKIPIYDYRSLPDKVLNPDVLVATGFQTVDYVAKLSAKRKFYFIQMMEHLFFPEGSNGYTSAIRSYDVARLNNFKIITIAEWLANELYNRWGFQSEIIPNGVNTKHFYKQGKKQGYILIEGDNRNRAKDIEGISWKVGVYLREKYGVKIWGYAALRHNYVDRLDKFVLTPSVTTIRKLYSGAKFLLKASRYEGRSCAPVEAMACGTTCVRGIIEGDNDLIDNATCLRRPYDLKLVREAADLMMTDNVLYERLTENASIYVDKFLDWNDIVNSIEVIFGV